MERPSYLAATDLSITPYPTPALEYPSGPVPLGSPFYVARPPLEEKACHALQQPGAVLRIKAPQEMGKSSLLLRILAEVDHWNYRSVLMDCRQWDPQALRDLNYFLRSFCTCLSQQLGMEPRLDDYWDGDRGCKLNATLYLQSYILPACQRPLLLILHEFNELFEFPDLCKEFFPLLRSWHEEAKRLPIWQNLRMAVVYATEAHLSLHRNQSPFNVGIPLVVPPFTCAQILGLAHRHGLPWEYSHAEILEAIVGGHPHLVRLALYHLALDYQRDPYGSPTLALQNLLAEALTTGGIYQEHLHRHWLVLQANPILVEQFWRVVAQPQGVLLDPVYGYKLESLGLVTLLGEVAQVRCQLYSRYFQQQYQKAGMDPYSPNFCPQMPLANLEYLQQENQRLRHLCNVDSLTQVANRRAFDEQLACLWQEAQRTGQPLALMLCDIDFFKAFNDSYGHPAGDECLRQVAQLIQGMVNPVSRETVGCDREACPLDQLDHLDPTQSNLDSNSHFNPDGSDHQGRNRLNHRCNDRLNPDAKPDAKSDGNQWDESHQIIPRSTALVARYGGEEFAVVLLNVDVNAAVVLGNNLRHQLRTLAMPVAALDHVGGFPSEYVTMSIGIACTVPQEESDAVDLVRAADNALYRAKNWGRDQVMVSLQAQFSYTQGSS